MKMHYIQRAVSRKRGCTPADSFVGIWKFIARPNLCETPACVKPPPRYTPAVERGGDNENKKLKRKKNQQKRVSLQLESF